MVHESFIEWPKIQACILEFEQSGVVTRTFHRLDTVRQKCIVNAILDEAEEHGPPNLNIKRIAERAGVAVGSLYQYFGNRSGLLAFTNGVCVRVLTDAFEQFKPILSALPLREALRMYLVGGMEWSETMQGLIQYYGRAAYTGNPALVEDVVRPVAEAMRETVYEILAGARSRGELRPDLDLEATSRAVNSWIIVLADSQMLPYLNHYFQVTDETVSFESILESTLDILEKGLLKMEMDINQHSSGRKVYPS
jgi:TetR/AcrR family transcriptional regulator